MDKIVEEYKRNGQKIAAQLLQRQSKDIKNLSEVFQQNCKQLYSAYGDASKNATVLRSTILSKRKRLEEVAMKKRQRLRRVQDVISAAKQELSAID